MKKISEPIVFFGSGPVAAASLEALAAGFTIEAAVTKQSPTHHHGNVPVKELAENLNLPLHFANTKIELDELIAKQQFRSRLGIIVDFGVIVSQFTINAFQFGILNSHFSLLPRWRGADPISFAILEGDKKTGVSLMLINPTLDTGKTLVQRSLEIDPEDTTPSLTDKLINLSNRLLVDYLPLYLDGKVKPRSQPHPDRATYSRKLTKDDGVIDWYKSAKQIEREIRAFKDWPKSHTILAGKDVIIIKARVVDIFSPPGKVKVTFDRKHLVIGCGAQALAIERLKPVGKQEMSAREFIIGNIRHPNSSIMRQGDIDYLDCSALNKLSKYP